MSAERCTCAEKLRARIAEIQAAWIEEQHGRYDQDRRERIERRLAEAEECLELIESDETEGAP